MASKFHRNSKTKEKALMDNYIRYVAPHMLASFALVLYDCTNLDLEDIEGLCVEVDKLWCRSRAEGWDIIQNCKDLTDLDMRSYIDMRHERDKE